MSIATFLYLKTARNIFKHQAKADVTQIAFSPVVALSSPIDSEDIHIGPRGSRYRFDALGRKVHLKVA